ncbi:Cytochrome P450 [Quillaja saponaria]|uniref:Cytochrome P450 n=1 Tax=Quillaja saponaria TaxID=32244 RepID=A0AAD7LHD9_QUISA|nr:Cytochrome P450 [Quillaja saponaria]
MNKLLCCSGRRSLRHQILNGHTEWAMNELAKDQNQQDRFHQELQSICGHKKITEENLPLLPYLGAVFHETLRKHSPVTVVPLRHAHEDTQLGGYRIHARSQIAIIYIWMSHEQEAMGKPDEWKPE